MKVRAKAKPNGAPDEPVGYYDLRVMKGGEEFTISDPRHFSERWMEKVEEPPVTIEPPKAEQEPEKAKPKKAKE
jgi:hypothetical protein